MRTLHLLPVALVCIASGVRAADWPQFRGPDRDGRSPEAGLLKSWPDGGPKLLLTIDGLGKGFSSAAVAKGRIYTTGIVGDKLNVFAFDKSGKKLWSSPVDNGWTKNYAGARSTPTLDDGRLYLLSGHGTVFCLDAAKGEILWQHDLRQYKERGAKVPRWGYAESLLVDERNVYCTPGGQACMLALDKRSGRPVWTSSGLSDKAHYGSPIVVDDGKMRQLVQFTAKGVVGLLADEGRFLWRYDRPANRTANCTPPLYSEGVVFAASGYNTGGGAVRLEVSQTGVKAQEIWQTKRMLCHHGAYVVVGGHVYGNNSGGWSCLDFASGEERWKERGVGKGSVIYADGMLYTLGQGGEMGLMVADPRETRVTGRFRLPNAGKQTWAHPSISDGSLYLRREDKLFVYDVRKR